MARNETISEDLWRRIDAALDEARDPDDGRIINAHVAAHRLAEKLSPEEVKTFAPTPSDADLRESAGGTLIKRAVSASQRRPQWENSLLRGLEQQRVVPEALVKLEPKRLIARGDLTDAEQRQLSKAAKTKQKAASEEARFEEALSDGFTKWANAQRRKGRNASELTQRTFWDEEGLLSQPSSVDDARERFDELRP
jgi:hypothetical protein